jgi:hypothetical protein
MDASDVDDDPDDELPVRELPGITNTPDILADAPCRLFNSYMYEEDKEREDHKKDLGCVCMDP